jgi:hypothetical protein
VSWTTGQLAAEVAGLEAAVDRLVAGASRYPPNRRLLDHWSGSAPGRGSVPLATQDWLAGYVGAAEATFEHVQPILAALGTLHHVRGPGSRVVAKLVINSTLGPATATTRRSSRRSSTTAGAARHANG